jgi:VWFA-related protein
MPGAFRSASPLFAQPQPQPFTGKIDVSLVNVDVTVTSRSEPVHGLTRDDFEVFEDGLQQPITSFDAVERPASAGRLNSPATSAEPRFRRHVLLIVDNPMTSAPRRNAAIERLESFIDDQFRGGDYDWSIVLVDRGVRMFLPTTSDKTKIHSALDVIRRTKGYPPDSPLLEDAPISALGPLMNDDDSWVQNLDDSRAMACRLGECDLALRDMVASSGQSFRAMVEALRAFATTEGKKVVLLLTSDSSEMEQFAFAHGGEQVSSQSMAMLRGMATQAKVRTALIREANASNVSLYIINTEGLQFESGRITSNGGLYWLARETGGRLMPGNDLAQSIDTFDAVSSNFYSLAYRQPHADDGKYHRIEVRLKRRGSYALQYRTGYSSIPPEVQMVRALLTPLSASVQNSAIPLSASTGDVKTLDGGIVLPIEAKIPFKDLQFTPDADGWSAHVDLYVSIFDEKGNNLSINRFTTVANAKTAEFDGELVHNATVKLKGGNAHTIVLAVRDQTSDAVGMWRKTIHF